MTGLAVRRHLDVLDGLVAVAGLDVVDVGCGHGALVRALTERGARATGVECGAAALAGARAAAPAAAERYLFGYGQDLPLADGGVDLVVFFNSLHHVPVADQPRALAESARVLRPGGRVYVLEPLAEGAYFEMVRPVDDETAVRAAALAALKAVEGLTEVTELVYLNPVRFADFTAFRDGFVAVDPSVRAPLMAARAAEMKARFEASARGEAGGYAFDQPSRVNLLVSVRSAD